MQPTNTAVPNMPELPEVEAIRHYLTAQNVIGAQIRNVHADPGVIQDDAHPRQLQGSSIDSINRRGKYIVLGLTNANADSPTKCKLIMHMVMTGSLHVQTTDQPATTAKDYVRTRALPRHETSNQQTDLRYVRASVQLDNGTSILLNDPRKWAKFWIVNDDHDDPTRKLGPEVTDLTPADFAQRFRALRTRIKPALLDQSLIAGIGNIYADEALHHARIRPTRRASNISTARLRNLHAAIMTVLDRATQYIIAHPAPDGSPYVLDAHDARMTLPRRGQPSCPTCDSTLTRTKIAGRTAIHCRKCQT